MSTTTQDQNSLDQTAHSRCGLHTALYEPSHYIPLIDNAGFLITLAAEPLPQDGAAGSYDTSEYSPQILQASANTALFGLARAEKLLGQRFHRLFDQGYDRLSALLVGLVRQGAQRKAPPLPLESCGKKSLAGINTGAFCNDHDTFADGGSVQGCPGKKAEYPLFQRFSQIYSSAEVKGGCTNGVANWWGEVYTEAAQREYVRQCSNKRLCSRYVRSSVAVVAQRVVSVSCFLVDRDGRPLIVCEFKPVDMEESTGIPALEVLHEISTAVSGLLHSASEPALYDATVAAAFQHVAFDRVVLYKMRDSGQTQVIAERKVGFVQKSLRGLRFPKLHIPQQLQVVLTLHGVKVWQDLSQDPVELVPPTVDAKAVDLTDSKLSCPNNHFLQSLRNEGVRSCIVAGLHVDGKFWGMLAGQNFSTTRISRSDVVIVRKLAADFCGRILQLKSARLAERRSGIQRCLRIWQHGSAALSVTQALENAGLSLLEALQVDCVAYIGRVGNEEERSHLAETLFLLGAELNKELIVEISISLGEVKDCDVKAIHNVSATFPELKPRYEKTPVDEQVDSMVVMDCATFRLLLIRTAHEETVRWADKAAFELARHEIQAEAGCCCGASCLAVRGLSSPSQEFLSVERCPPSAWKDVDMDGVSQVLEALMRVDQRERRSFLSVLNHELRTPFNGITGISSVLQEAELEKGEGIPAPVKALLNVMESSSSSVLNILDGILCASRLNLGAREIHQDRFKPLALMQTTRKLFGAKAIEAEAELDISTCRSHRTRERSFVTDELLGDSQRLMILLVKLVGIALEEGGRRGKVVTTWDTYDSLIGLIGQTETALKEYLYADKIAQVLNAITKTPHKLDDRWVYIRISCCSGDEFGFEEEEVPSKRLKRLLMWDTSEETDPWQEKLSSICRDVCLAISAAIWFRTPVVSDNLDTLFEVVVRLREPVHTLQTEPHPRNGVADINSNGICRPVVGANKEKRSVKRLVIAADDSSINRMVLKSIIKRAMPDSECRMYEDGKEAYDAVCACKGRPLLVLLDYHMPVMDGLTAGYLGRIMLRCSLGSELVMKTLSL